MIFPGMQPDTQTRFLSLTFCLTKVKLLPTALFSTESIVLFVKLMSKPCAKFHCQVRLIIPTPAGTEGSRAYDWYSVVLVGLVLKLKSTFSTPFFNLVSRLILN